MQTVARSIASTNNAFTPVRLFLAASVVYFHAFALSRTGPNVDPLAAWLFLPTTDIGSLAVEGFFFVSGLFVTQSFVRDPRLLDFALRRGLRIWPGLLVCLALTVLAAWLVTPEPKPQWRPMLGYVGNNAGLRTTYALPGVFADHKNPTLNGPLYTLVIEAKMYLVLGVAGACRILSTRALIAGFALVGLAALLLVPETASYLLAVKTRHLRPVAMFLLGVLTFALAEHLRPRLWQAGLLIAALAVVPEVARVGVAMGLTVWAILRLGQSRWLSRAFRLKADYSYGVYIYGWPCAQLVLVSWADVGPYSLTVLTLIPTLLCAILSWHGVEKPAIDLGRALIRRVRGSPPVPPVLDALPSIR